MEKVYTDAVEALNKYSKNETKDTAKVLEAMTEDKKNYLKFILRQIEFNTDFAKWFKASLTMDHKEKDAFDRRVRDAIHDKDNS